MAYRDYDELQTIDVNRKSTHGNGSNRTSNGSHSGAHREQGAGRRYEEDDRRSTRTSGSSHKNTSSSHKKKKKGQKKGAVIAIAAFCGVLLVVLIVLAIIIGKVNGWFNKINKETTQSVAEGESFTYNFQTMPNVTREPVESEETLSPDIDNLDEAKELLAVDDAKTFFYSSEPAESNYVKNILLIGLDNRGNEGDWYGNSDSMIMVSINSKTKKIVLTSFMRDLYVFLPDYPEGDHCDKLNFVHAVGGSGYLCDVISNTFKVKVDQYAKVDFYSLIDIIDAAGGIDMYVSDAEKDVLNMYIYYMCIEAVPAIENPEQYYLNEADKVVHLTGMQAVGFARIRYVGNSDYERTERQRRVITALSDNIKNMGIVGIDNFANKVLPLVTTNMTNEDLWGLVGEALNILSYEIVSQRVPYDDTSSSKIIDYQDVLLPDYYTNASMLIESIYGD